ncbi:uncharacterized protein LOC110007698 [Amborella trichopoda]|uniref:uncharacterized protein LOC110007698 n=1 Tax=Amborella trichopoda TaxID=13333 RepID=UPI0009BEAC02|nr:uncharacterized protein LOC110007698 [Amborella trichopoda]|eukprot:XP_020525891.1 uncharacterized protein LOC110007698 [Amborella trichopoda]
MGVDGIRLLTVVAISGGVLLLALGRRKFLRPQGEQEEGHHHNLKSNLREAAFVGRRSSGSGKKKRVRFSEDVKEPSGNNVEYRRRHVHASNGVRNRERVNGGVKHVPITNACKQNLLSNRAALYHGQSQYRSQMATLMIYA